jgi:hypothetical protein
MIDLEKFLKELIEFSPASLSVENVIADDLVGLDGYIPLPSHMEQTGRYIANMFVMLKKTRIAPRYVKGVYKGVDCVDFNIPSRKMHGIYLISYDHPIGEDRSGYIGTTIDNPRSRLGKFVKAVATGQVRDDENGAAAMKWIAKHGNKLDYASAIFIPIDLPQRKLRGTNGLEGWVIRYFNEKYPNYLLNTNENPTLTLEKKIPTPALEGI